MDRQLHHCCFWRRLYYCKSGADCKTLDGSTAPPLLSLAPAILLQMGATHPAIHPTTWSTSQQSQPSQEFPFLQNQCTSVVRGETTQEFASKALPSAPSSTAQVGRSGTPVMSVPTMLPSRSMATQVLVLLEREQASPPNWALPSWSQTFWEARSRAGWTPIISRKWTWWGIGCGENKKFIVHIGRFWGTPPYLLRMCIVQMRRWCTYHSKQSWLYLSKAASPISSATYVVDVVPSLWTPFHSPTSGRRLEQRTRRSKSSIQYRKVYPMTW